MKRDLISSLFLLLFHLTKGLYGCTPTTSKCPFIWLLQLQLNSERTDRLDHKYYLEYVMNNGEVQLQQEGDCRKLAILVPVQGQTAKAK